MKHIKAFNESSVATKEVIQNVRDILMDLKDDGLYVQITNYKTGLVAKIALKKDNYVGPAPMNIWFPKAKDNILTLIDYMKSISYNYNLYMDGHNSELNIDEFERVIEYRRVKVFVIEFY